MYVTDNRPYYSTSPNTRRSPSLHALFLSVTFLPEQRSLLQHTDPPPDTILSNLAAVPENSMLPAPETLQNSVPVQRTSTEPLPEPLTWNAASFAFSCFISILPAPDTKTLLCRHSSCRLSNFHCLDIGNGLCSALLHILL